MVLDDKVLAMLGDRAAQERVTERGELLPCPFCGGTEIMEASCQSSIWYFCGNDNCQAVGPTAYNEAGARLLWNTRAPILTPDQIKRLEEMK